MLDTQALASEESFITPPTGLDRPQVQARVAAEQTNATTPQTGRTLKDIIRANVFTPFNALMLTLFAVIMSTGRWQNGLFFNVVLINIAIGIIQEVRARATLNKLSVMNAPSARVVREGTEQDISIDEVVLDDLLVLRTGDQVPADATLVMSRGLEVDESLLTGESDPIPKTPGDQVRSGSLVVGGIGRAQATAVGAQAHAAQLAQEARRFSLTKSELVAGTNKILHWVTLVMVVVSPLLIWSQFRSPDNYSWHDAVTGVVAALVGMVPDGLILLTSMAFVLAIMSLARKKTLVQELPAVEGLARVDVVCLDKTGTLTEGEIALDQVRILSAEGTSVTDQDIHHALGLISRQESNATAQAIGQEMTSTTWAAAGNIPFSSARKWSAVCPDAASDAGATWVLGAPEFVLPHPETAHQVSARQEADDIAESGSRVLVLARSPQAIPQALRPDPAASDAPELPAGLVPAALVVLSERVRADASLTLGYFASQGVELKVISGDNPRTVGAVAARVGVPGVTGAGDAFDARELPDDLEELAQVMDKHVVFGRVTPTQKQAMVKALQHRGRVVAMTGDGVNDALALKDADIGVAMGSGAAATRAVAQLVLLDNKFAHLPDVVAEGRRVIANIERAANLFLARNAYALLLAFIVAITGSSYPFAPIQFTLVNAITIGIPGFILALGPNKRRYIPGFLTRVLRFAIPTGVIVGAMVYLSFNMVRILDSSATISQARTAVTIVAALAGLWIVGIASRPLTRWKVALLTGLAGIFAAAVAIPAFSHRIFLLEPTWQAVVIGLLGGAIAASSIELIRRWVVMTDEDLERDHLAGRQRRS